MPETKKRWINGVFTQKKKSTFSEENKKIKSKLKIKHINTHTLAKGLSFA